MALGAGLLIGSVAFELVDEALRTRTVAGVGLFVLVGSAAFTVGDWRMWSAVIVVSALSAALGYAVLDPAHGTTGALVQAFAAGALLAMLATTMLPEAYEREGLLTGPLVVLGFAASLALSAV